MLFGVLALTVFLSEANDLTFFLIQILESIRDLRLTVVLFVITYHSAGVEIFFDFRATDIQVLTDLEEFTQKLRRSLMSVEKIKISKRLQRSRMLIINS